MSQRQQQRGGRTNNNNRNQQRTTDSGQSQQQRSGGQPNTKRSIRYTGLVRAVPSGDTVVLVNLSPDTTVSGPPKEIQLTLWDLKAPLLGRKTQDEVKLDQDFAWESREYLRKLLIGKSVVYRIEHEVPGRCYGEIWLDEKDVRFSVVENGWSAVKEKKEKEGMKREDQELEELQALMEKAQANKCGMWSGKKSKRTVNYYENVRNGNDDALFNFFNKNKGKSLQGIVEQVRTGTTLRVYIPSTQDEFVINLSGARSPVYKFNDESACEPFSREAKFFTEHCLLNRDVTITLEAMDNQSNFYGTVLDGQKRNISPNLLKMGLATFVEWNAPREHLAAWKEAEKQAQEGKLRVWKSFSKTTSTATRDVASDANELSGQVIEIVNAGTIVLRVKKGNDSQDVVVRFSSIRVPRAVTKGQKSDELNVDPEEQKAFDARKADESLQNTYAIIAKEFLRKALIAKNVRCKFDYTRSGPTGNTPVKYYSVYLGKMNIAVDLLRKGYGNVVFHQAEEPRSSEYSQMIIAEKAAKHDVIGIHQPASKAPVFRVNDLSSESEPKCRHFLAALKRAGTLPAVVQFPFSGSKFKLHLPTQDLTISFAVQGCLSEKTEKFKSESKDGVTNFRQAYPVINNRGEPIPANAALHFARDQLLQRDVEVTIDEMDRAGTFFGKITVNKSDYLLQLISAGLSKLHRGSVSKWANFATYDSAENEAKRSKRGVWWNFNQKEEDERIALLRQKRQDERDQVQQQNKAKSKMEVTVTEIITGSIFFFQLANEESKSLVEDMMADFGSRPWESLPPYSPEHKEWVAAKFSVDGAWYRAEVLQVFHEYNKSEAEYELRYVDYGNTEVVTCKNIRKLDSDFESTKYKANAQKGKLAYINAPHTSEEFGEDAAALLKELVWGRTVLANVQYTEGMGSDTVYHVLLGVPETEGEENGDDKKKEGKTVNGYLVVEGLARVEGRRKTRVVNYDIYSILEKEQSKAKSKRVGMWQYGEIPDSDEDRQWANMLR